MDNNSLIKALQYYSIFEGGGILSKKVSLNYKATSKQPWTHFFCKAREKYSFVIHELEMDPSESMLWHLAVQQDEKVNFQGFLTFGKLRGYLTIPEKNYKIGVLIKSGRIEKLVNQKELEKTNSEFSALISYSVNSFAESDKKLNPTH